MHPWKASFEQAIALQASLRERLRFCPIKEPVRLVAGTDVAYSRPTHRMYAAVVVLALPGFDVVETVRAVRRARFPYIPGLFSFREVPPLLAALRRLRCRPDVFLCDGQGLAHPRRFGLACHLGLLLDRPTVGCAKSLLVGEHSPLALPRGATAPLVDRGETVGASVRTRDGVRPVYVSAGHLSDLDSAVRLVLRTVGRYRLPEPTRLAHQATAALQRHWDNRLPLARVHDYPDFVGR
jgi:deoxyribonuclease V